MTAKRPPELADFTVWFGDVHKNAKRIDPEGDRDWNTLAFGFLLARDVDPRVAADWELLSAFTCGDKPRAEAAIAVAERTWLAHDWCDRLDYSETYRDALVAVAFSEVPPAGVDVAAWVRSIDDAAWVAADSGTIGTGVKRKRGSLARAYLEARAHTARQLKIEAINTARKARRIAEMRASLNIGASLPPCADPAHPERLCSAHDRGYDARYACAPEGQAPALVPGATPPSFKSKRGGAS